jgi:hypothetical protein
MTKLLQTLPERLDEMTGTRWTAWSEQCDLREPRCLLRIGCKRREEQAEGKKDHKADSPHGGGSLTDVNYWRPVAKSWSETLAQARESAEANIPAAEQARQIEKGYGWHRQGRTVAREWRPGVNVHGL